MKERTISRVEYARIDKLVRHYSAKKMLFDRLVAALITLFTTNDQLPPFTHSIKGRAKDPEHLRDKLKRKLLKAKKEKKPFDITVENLFSKINDLAGIRILHLHTTQMGEIDKRIRKLLAEESYRISQGPFARTWDDEYRTYFDSLGIQWEKSEEMYTSVHYVVTSSAELGLTAEVQVRTLAEELWGEVTHTVNYPHKSESIACREQIKVLARVTSACTRLVDAIFLVNGNSKKVIKKNNSTRRGRVQREKGEKGVNSRHLT